MNYAEERAAILRQKHEARAKYVEASKTSDAARAAELEAQGDAMLADADAKEARLAKMEKIDAYDAAIAEVAESALRAERDNRSIDLGKPEDREARHAAAFIRYLGGKDSAEDRAFLAQESRAMSALQSNGSTGGYIVPTTYVNGILKVVYENGPMLRVAKVIRTAGGNPMKWATSDDTTKGSLIAENTQVGEATITFGTKQLDAYKFTSNVVLIPTELIEDSPEAVDAHVSTTLGERLGKAINEYLTTGSGSSQPHGVVTATAGSPGKTATANSTVSYDDLVDLQHSVKNPYRRNGVFMFNDNTLKVIRKLKDSENRPLWEPELRSGAPASILGRPYEINDDMADIGATAVSVLFGDFAEGYYAREARGIQVRRLDERYGDYDQVGIVGFARVDGELMNAKAIKSLKHPS